MLSDLAAELTAFMRAYEQANNSHDIDRVSPMISPDASYWFTDGSYHGLSEITAAIRRTFSSIQNEAYHITDLQWIVLTAEHAACRYRFSWTGVIGGVQRSGRGRGTNVMVKHGGLWRIQHEHLSGLA
jgi:ketosteroid isomerase-like protein